MMKSKQIGLKCYDEEAMRKRALSLGIAGLLALPVVAEIRLVRASRPGTDDWRTMPIVPHKSTKLGLSFRPRQAEALGLDLHSTLRDLLAYPFEIIRLGAYWNHVEPNPGAFDSSELDWQIEAAERAGKKIVLGLGALKTFGYPEFYAPAYQLHPPLQEGRRVTPSTHASLLAMATAFVVRLVERYRTHPGIVAWQVENEAVDPLGIEHSWRLDRAFVEEEVRAVRRADPSRPILMNGFLPATLPGLLAQSWQTRDQGDSLAVAQRLADVVGVDYYPRYALAALGPRTLYLDGARSPWARWRLRRLLARTRQAGQKLMISEGQAEPWETTTVPPNPSGDDPYSCPPEQVIATYNRAMSWSPADAPFEAYLFWGAEYWILRSLSGDPRYLQAFSRILESG